MYSLSIVVAYTKKEERQRQQAKQTHNLLVNIVVWVLESYLYYDSCEESRLEINNIMCILSMSTINTSIFEYEYDIKITMIAYKYHWLWVRFESTHRFEYSDTCIYNTPIQHYNND